MCEVFLRFQGRQLVIIIRKHRPTKFMSQNEEVRNIVIDQVRTTCDSFQGRDFRKQNLKCII